jgi:hypothetical protein
VKKQQAFIPAGLDSWIDARQRFRLSHAHVQMARELGMNPKKLGKLANHDQEPCEAGKDAEAQGGQTNVSGRAAVR